MTAKTYSTAANARRAARQSGLIDGTYTITEADGRFTFAVVEQQEEPMETPDETVEVGSEGEEVLDLTTMNTLEANRATSSIKKPVRYVHDRCAELHAENPSIRRKDVVATLVAEGIAYYTARTQVQVWKKAHPNGVAPAALQPEVEEEVVDPDVLVLDGGALIDDQLHQEAEREIDALVAE